MPKDSNYGKALVLAQANILFSLYPKLAERVTNLRTILQNIETTPPTHEDAIAWSDDMKSVLRDLMSMGEQTAFVLVEFLPSKE